MAMDPKTRPQLTPPDIELSTGDHELRLMELLSLEGPDRADKIKQIEQKLREKYQEPIKRGSDRWVFCTPHVVYKIPSPTSYGHGQAGIFASIAEAKNPDPNLAECEIVYTPDGIPIVVMERVEITHEEIDGPQKGMTQDGREVHFDGGHLGY